MCNHDPDLFVTPYIEFMRNIDVKTFKPSFDQLMSSAFWASYCSERFDIDYDDDIPFDERFECDSLDSSISFELSMMLQISLFESISNGNVSTNTDQKRSTYINEFINDILLGSGMIEVSRDTSDYFSQIGNTVFLTSAVVYIFTRNSEELMLGHFGAASSLYLG